MSLRLGRLLASIVCTLVVAACTARDAPHAEIPAPSLEHLEPQVVEAIERAQRAVAERPDDATAWGELGAVYDAHLLSDPAEVSYRRAQELGPGEFRWIYLLAIVREINGAEADELADLFRRAAELQPDYAPVHLRLGDALWRRGQLDEARRALERALELAPETALAHRRLGQVLLAQGDTTKATRYLERATELEPRDLGAWVALGQLHSRLGDEARSRAIVEQSRGLEPVNALDDPVHASEVVSRNVGSDHLFRSGVELVRSGDNAQAIERLSVAAAASPTNPSAHYWLGVAQRRAGQLQEAEVSLDRALELEPRMNAARLELAELRSAPGRGAAWDGEVQAHGSLRAMFHEGEIGPKVALDALLPDRDLYALGALAGLSGEVTILGGKTYLSYPAGEVARTETADRTDAAATLLVTTRVLAWRSVRTAQAIPFAQLDRDIATLAASAGMAAGARFPFLVQGEFEDLRWHVIDGKRVSSVGASHQDHLAAAVHLQRQRAQGTLVGFYSESDQGVFTHMGSKTHLHCVVERPLATGHVDHVVIPPGTVVKFPERPGRDAAR